MKPSIAIASGVCLASLLLTTGACLNLNKSYPEKRSFVLAISSETQQPAPEATMVLKISRFRVSPLFVGRPMVYRPEEFRYENDFYDEWFVSPGAMLTQQFHDWLSKSGRFQLVMIGTNHIEPTHLLEGSVTQFYGDYRFAGAPKAIFEIRLLLLDGQVIFRRTYHEEVPLADRSADALASGLTQAVRLVLVDVERELAEVAGKRQKS